MSEVTDILRLLGWRVRSTGEQKQCIRNFQRIYALTAALRVDGIAGPRTTAALRLCKKRHNAHLPDISAHFSCREVACRCGGRFSNCQRIWAPRSAILKHEKHRKALGHGLSIVSGNRCPGWNAHVRGAKYSRHVVGDAADFRPEHSVSWYRSRGIYNGLGYDRSTGHVRHGDQGGTRSWAYHS
jgi:zinc D-Ala-D-Ala carboxypeptidase